MFSLIFGFWDYIFHKANYFVLILGLDNSGKSTFLEHSKCNYNKNTKILDFNRIATTVGLNVGRIETNGVMLNFWDLGGQRELRPLWDKYFSEAHGIIWIVDSSDESRLNESVDAFKSVIKNDLLYNLPLLFVINKQDIATAMKPSEVIDAFRDNLDLLGNRKFLPLPVSALKGNGIRESICWIAEEVKSSPRPPSET